MHLRQWTPRRPSAAARGGDGLSTRSRRLVVAAPASKRPSRGDKKAQLPPNVRPWPPPPSTPTTTTPSTPSGGKGAEQQPAASLSDNERALLAAAVRDSNLLGGGAKSRTAAVKPPSSSSKGFGATATAAASSSPSVSAAASPPVRPIDAREAARGRVELVNVRNWGGGGERAEAGELEVVSVRTLVGGKEGAPSADPSAASPSAPPPLHVALAQQLQLAEARGALSIAASPSSRALPPFELWSFSEHSYAQYLADHAEAHAALDDAVDEAAEAAEAARPSSDPLLKAALALRWFSRARGLARGDAYRSDLQAMSAATTPPSNGAAALAKQLRRLGRDAATSSDHDAALKLAAHAYALRAAHFSGSGRITAAAEARLQLSRRGALAAVARYGGAAARSPSSPLPPPAAFSADVDAYGREMMGGEEGDHAAWAAPMFAELPAAFRKASALLDGLAVEEG
jgi:hypothetical protein